MVVPDKNSIVLERHTFSIFATLPLAVPTTVPFKDCDQEIPTNIFINMSI